jgi:hypothetical protein
MPDIMPNLLLRKQSDDWLQLAAVERIRQQDDLVPL